eukprot:9634814-Alexandrium_andersonii.AAC.1
MAEDASTHAVSPSFAALCAISAVAFLSAVCCALQWASGKAGAQVPRKRRGWTEGVQQGSLSPNGCRPC